MIRINLLPNPYPKCYNSSWMASKKQSHRSNLARGLARARWNDPDQHVAASDRAKTHKPWLNRRLWSDLSDDERQARIQAMILGRKVKREAKRATRSSDTTNQDAASDHDLSAATTTTNTTNTTNTD